jgi:hypothetical protein
VQTERERERETRDERDERDERETRDERREIDRQWMVKTAERDKRARPVVNGPALLSLILKSYA